MKILHVITNFAYRGGAEQMLARLIEKDIHNEHYIVSVLEISEMYQQTLNRCKGHLSLNWNLLNTISVSRKLLEFVKEHKPDIIQCWMYHGNFFGVIAKVFSSQKFKLFWGVHHSLSSYKDESITSKTSLLVGKFLARYTNAVIFCSQVSKLQHEKFGYAGNHNLFIPNGIPIENFINDLSMKKFDEQVVFGCAGRYHSAKGYPYLVEAISILQNKSKDFVFLLAGRDMNERNNELMALFRKFQVRMSHVKFLDEVDNMHKFYQGIDCLVLSSITEGFPTVLIEAMSMGVTCITTDVGDAAYIVDKFGTVIQPRQAKDLADALYSYLSLAKTDKEHLSREVQAYAQNKFSIEQVIVSFNKTWQLY